MDFLQVGRYHQLGFGVQYGAGNIVQRLQRDAYKIWLQTQFFLLLRVAPCTSAVNKPVFSKRMHVQTRLQVAKAAICRLTLKAYTLTHVEPM